VDEKELIETASTCQHLARMLGNRQSSDTVMRAGLLSRIRRWWSGQMYDYVMPPHMTTKLVNALLDAGNRLEVIARQGFTPPPPPKKR
jgi:HD-like signal output (HDOD) protein